MTLSILYLILVGTIDANLKGRAMAHYHWDDIPNFWKHNKGAYEYILTALSAIGAFFLMLTFFNNIIHQFIFIFSVFFLFLSGFPSIIYWWMLKPLNIKQCAHWDNINPDRFVYWFEYPDKAPWLDDLIIPLIFSNLCSDSHTTSRNGVYLGSFFFIFLLFLVESFIFLHNSSLLK